MTKRYRFHAPRGGVSHQWESDHVFVKVDAADTGHAYTVVEDNLKADFTLGLHLHRQHAETFYILDGSLEFFVDGDWMTAATGACLHIPPGIPHAVKVSPGVASARMLMIFQPSGFDGFLSELSSLSAQELSDDTVMTALQDKYDIVQLGPVPEQPQTRAVGP